MLIRYPYAKLILVSKLIIDYVVIWNLKTKIWNESKNIFVVSVVCACVCRTCNRRTDSFYYSETDSKPFGRSRRAFLVSVRLFFWFSEHSYPEKLRDQARRRFGNRPAFNSAGKRCHFLLRFTGKDERTGPYSWWVWTSLFWDLYPNGARSWKRLFCLK